MDSVSLSLFFPLYLSLDGALGMLVKAGEKEER
jgi:hypothetical protein